MSSKAPSGPAVESSVPLTDPDAAQRSTGNSAAEDSCKAPELEISESEEFRQGFRKRQGRWLWIILNAGSSELPGRCVL